MLTYCMMGAIVTDMKLIDLIKKGNFFEYDLNLKPSYPQNGTNSQPQNTGGTHDEKLCGMFIDFCQKAMLWVFLMGDGFGTSKQIKPYTSSGKSNKSCHTFHLRHNQIPSKQ